MSVKKVDSIIEVCNIFSHMFYVSNFSDVFGGIVKSPVHRRSVGQRGRGGNQAHHQSDPRVLPDEAHTRGVCVSAGHTSAKSK